jgi:hypothetical protein
MYFQSGRNRAVEININKAMTGNCFAVRIELAVSATETCNPNPAAGLPVYLDFLIKPRYRGLFFRCFRLRVAGVPKFYLSEQLFDGESVFHIF